MLLLFNMVSLLLTILSLCLILHLKALALEDVLKGIQKTITKL
jgi:hypothetical protein